MSRMCTAFCICFWLSLGLGELSAQQWKKVDIPLESFDVRLIESQIIPEIPDLLSSELILIDKAEGPTGFHLTLKQAFAGMEVFQSEVRLHVNKAGRIYGMTSKTFSPPVGLPLPKKKRQDVLSRPQVAAQLEGAQDFEEKMCWWVEDGEWKEAFHLFVFRNDGGMAAREWVMELDKGDVLMDEDAGVYFGGKSSMEKRDTTGYGRVFLPDPITRAKAPYGVEFNDDKDSHSPIFESLMDTIVLRDITYMQEEGLFVLEGPYVKVVDRASFFNPIATSLDGNFFYDRSQSGFEDVMAYYHIDNFRRYIDELGFKELYNKPIEIDPHGLGNNDQSVFVANGGNSYILMGDGGVDDAEDADVIIHEYIHALSNDAAPGSNRGFERKGIDEGYADYFAAAYSFDLSRWNWFELFNWDGHNEFWDGRKAISLESYPPINGFTSIYDVGELWASTLMNIRLDLGEKITDQLVLQSMYFSYKDMGLEDASVLLLQADTALFDGIYTPVIRDRLCQRNLFSSPFCIAVNQEKTLSSPSVISIGPNPVQDQLQLEWEGYKEVDIRLFNIQGQELMKEKIKSQGGRTLRLAPEILPGYYFLQIEEKGKEPLVHKLNIVGL